MIPDAEISRTGIGKDHDPKMLLERKLKACLFFLSTTVKLKEALAEEKTETALQLLQDRAELIRVIGVLDNLIDHGNPSSVNSGGSGDVCRRRILHTLQEIERWPVKGCPPHTAVICWPGCPVSGSRERVSRNIPPSAKGFPNSSVANPEHRLHSSFSRKYRYKMQGYLFTRR